MIFEVRRVCWLLEGVIVVNVVGFIICNYYIQMEFYHNIKTRATPKRCLNNSFCFWTISLNVNGSSVFISCPSTKDSFCRRSIIKHPCLSIIHLRNKRCSMRFSSNNISFFWFSNLIYHSGGLIIFKCVRLIHAPLRILNSCI